MNLKKVMLFLGFVFITTGLMANNDRVQQNPVRDTEWLDDMAEEFLKVVKNESDRVREDAKELEKQTSQLKAAVKHDGVYSREAEKQYDDVTRAYRYLSETLDRYGIPSWKMEKFARVSQAYFVVREWFR